MIPLIAFDDFRQPPPPPAIVFIFQANLSCSPSESFQSFQWSTLLGSQLLLIPPFVLLKVKWSPKILHRPPPPAMNNDWSLNKVTPNRLEANRVAIYKCGRWFERWTIENKSSQRSGWDLNSRFPNCKSSALMAQSRCLLSSISWETAHLPLP